MPISAVLPLSVRGSYDIDDLNRADLLFATLTAFAEPGLFSKFLVITPESEVEIVSRHFQKWENLNLHVISEDELVPEFKTHNYLRGWRKQQIIKLAAAKLLETPFFITFDADVICLRPLKYEDLIVDGRALIQLGERQGHIKWWKSSAAILKIAPESEADPQTGMAVTPAILATQSCIQLIQSINITGEGSWVEQLCRLHAPFSFRSFRLRYQRMRKWTEYTLYFLFAANHGLLDTTHIPTGGAATPLNLLTFRPTKDFDNWDPSQSFAPDGNSIFAIVGSKTRVSPAVVWKKIKPQLPLENLQGKLSNLESSPNIS